jgi:glycosyltransferase involved in cell wall biosynthesis
MHNRLLQWSRNHYVNRAFESKTVFCHVNGIPTTTARRLLVKVAIVHHWFVSLGGGERVAEVLAAMFPEADIFCLVVSPDGLPASMVSRSVTTSILQRIPGASRIHRHLLPLYPFAVEELDLTSYDLVLTSDSGPMKGIITKQDAVHVCYCHSPMRYLWDGYYSYKAAMPALTRLPFSIAAHYVRNWDYLAAQRVTHFVANSRYVAKRIQRYYGRESVVVYPPVDVQRGYLSNSPSNYYLAAGRLVPYKKTDILIEACNRLGRKLRVLGSGPEMNRLKRLAGPTIEFQSRVSTDELWYAYANCRALLFAADEDFGMVPVEAQSCGRPVIAFGKGGSLETVRAAGPSRNLTGEKGSPTGIMFKEQTPEQVMHAILQFEACEKVFSPVAIQEHASQFHTDNFVHAMLNLLNEILPGTADILQEPFREPAA